MPSKNSRKILQVGDSKAVVLPPDWLRAMGLKKGESVEVLYNSVVIIKPLQVTIDFDALKNEWKAIQKKERQNGFMSQ